jgi:hypothetical protein
LFAPRSGAKFDYSTALPTTHPDLSGSSDADTVLPTAYPVCSAIPDGDRCWHAAHSHCGIHYGADVPLHVTHSSNRVSLDVDAHDLAILQDFDVPPVRVRLSPPSGLNTVRPPRLMPPVLILFIFPPSPQHSFVVVCRHP